MLDWLINVESWHWWLLAGAFLLLELSWPRYIFLLLGIIAASVGFLLSGFPSMPFKIQLLVFLVLSAGAAIGWYRYREA